MVIPFFLIGIDATFSQFYYMAVGKAATPEALRDVWFYGTPGALRWPLLLNFLFLYGPLIAWYYPIWKYIRTKDPELKDVVRRRLSTVYQAIVSLFCLLFAANIAAHLVLFREHLVLGHFLRYNLPAMGFSAVLQMGFAGVFIEQVIGNSGGVLIETLYTREELFTLREGRYVPLVYKIGILIACAAVVPLILLYLYFRNFPGVDGYAIQAVYNLVQVSCIILLIGISLLLGTLQRPINGLIEKMKKLAAGDFDVKSRIYFSDEVAQIKASFNRMVDQLKERETLRETFGKYVSVEVAKRLMRSGGVDLGGEEIEATVLFSDIRNFTPMSEKMTAKEVVAFLNEYFSFVTAPIMENHGVINKFMGDAVMAIYAPILGSEDHAADAVRSALGMREALKRFNASGKLPFEVRFGVGIQTGKLVAGNVGTLARLEYTVIGDTVNVAARLESATKDHSADILISEEVHSRVKDRFSEDTTFTSIGDVDLKGKSSAMHLYAVH